MNEMEKRIDYHNIFALSDQTGECYLASCQCDLKYFVSVFPLVHGMCTKPLAVTPPKAAN
jgi:hypothetical protein